MLMLLTLNNGVFPVTMQRSYVQLNDRSTVPVQHGPRVGQVDKPFVWDREKPTYIDDLTSNM